MADQPTLPKVLVILAAYNGERHIGEQIESILAQQGVQVDLLILDDGSTDGTPAICESYAGRLPNVVFVQQQANLGVGANFMSGVYAADPDAHDYYAFSDQDDVWLPEKLQRAIEKMEPCKPHVHANATAPPADGDVAARHPVVVDSNSITPTNMAQGCLYYSDVTDVDENLQGGTREFAALAPCQNHLESVLIYGFAAGCTMVFDRDLCRLLQRHVPPAFPRLHDCWVHLVALTCATVAPDLEHSYIKRRLTGGNTVGNKTPGQLGARRIVAMLRNTLSGPDRPLTHAARLLVDGYGDLMAPSTRDLVESFSRLNRTPASRLRYLFDPAFTVNLPKEMLVVRIKMLLGIM